MFKKESLLLMAQITTSIVLSSVIVMIAIKPMINKAATVLPPPVK